MGGFDVIVLQGICANYFDKHVAPLLSEVKQSQEDLRAQVKALSVAIEQKPTGDVIAKCVEQNASITRLDEVIAQLDLKTTASEEVSTEAPSTDQFELWLGEAEQKIAAALAPIEERQAITDKTVRQHAAKIAEYKSVDGELQCKANVRDVPSLEQFKRLKDTVERKANKVTVPTVVQFDELREVVESKVNASGVPTLAEFTELRHLVEKKANASSVPAAVDLQKVLAEVQLKANAEDVEKALGEKANADQVSLTSTVDNLASVMERKLAFLAARLQKTSESVDHVLSQAMVCYIPTTGCGQQQWMGQQDQAGTWMIPAGGEALAPGGWSAEQCQGSQAQAPVKPEGDANL